MPSTKHDQLFRLAETDPKLRDELNNAHMFEFWDTRYHQWSDIIKDKYPIILSHSPKLQFALQLAEMASEYYESLKKIYDETPYAGRAKDLALLLNQTQLQLSMAKWSMRNFIKEIELEVPKDWQ